LEYPVALVLACALRPWAVGARHEPRVRKAFDVALPVLLALGLAWTLRMPDHPIVRMGGSPLLVYGAFAAIALAFLRRPLRFAGGVAALFVGTQLGHGRNEALRFHDRSFFGVYRVLEYPAYHLLQSGTTTHGAQSTEEETRLEPLTYYHREGPLGQALTTLLADHPSRRVAIVGLGTGTVACYARDGERWTFYEIDPRVVRIARDARWFSYLRECQPDARIVLGDARRSLAVEPDSAFDLIVLDAFSSDAIPTHLMTREALAMYLRKLAPGGSIAFHISNRYLDLEPVLAELARDARVPGIVGMDTSLTVAQRARELSMSRWVVVSRKATDHATLLRRPGWRVLPPSAPVRMWTDDFSDVLSVFRWRRQS
ncbi:MAG TPA: fused MFS/spermidine synthase, partial [Gemmatimonadales bacterium]|nr:fused MFS/spermidine synthase [Gemmatimonadales bacterium]